MTDHDQPTAGVALKPCPFCGDRPRLFGRTDAKKRGAMYDGTNIKCSGPGCGASVYSTTSANKADAIAAWNTRTPASGAVEGAFGPLKLAVEMADDYNRLKSPEKPRRLVKDFLLDEELRAAVAALTSEPKAEGALTVWYGKMPESNGRENWTAQLCRKADKGFDFHTNGYTFARSEYPDRVRYEADHMAWLIGERSEEPNLLAYDADKHSGMSRPNPYKGVR